MPTCARRFRIFLFAFFFACGPTDENSRTGCDLSSDLYYSAISPSLGPAGTRVRVTGNGFDPQDTQVIFDATPVPLVSLAANHADFLVPEGAYSDEVKVLVDGKPLKPESATGFLSTTSKTLPLYFTVLKRDDEPWLKVSTGLARACGIKASGMLYCWGQRNSQLAKASSVGEASFFPSAVSRDTGWTELSVSESSLCALKQGELWCQNGDWNVDPRSFEQIGLEANWVTVSTSGSEVCAIKQAGQLSCLSQGATPVTQPQVDGSWKRISVAGDTMCGIKKTDDSLWCWGNNADKMADPTTSSETVTAPVQIGSTSNWVEVAHSCALNDNGELWCWGGPYSQNQPTTPVAADAAEVPGADGGFPDWSSISVNRSSSRIQLCGITKGQELTCLIDGSMRSLDLVSRWQSVSVGEQSACAIKLDGSLWCWGDGSSPVEVTYVTVPPPLP